MNITIDTINKEIILNENVNLHDFYEEINTLLPGGKWREFTLKTNIKLDINNPIPWNDWVTPNPYQSTPQPITSPYWVTPNPHQSIPQPLTPPYWNVTCGSDSSIYKVSDINIYGDLTHVNNVSDQPN